jgi:ferredoxin--NADP+ reductase
MSEWALGSTERPLRVAVIGSGPSGFYAIGALFKSDRSVEVDLIDRLPTPFGLVRGGVAPDHQKIKSVIRAYEKIAANDAFRFIGNVHLGRDLTIEELKDHYDQIVLATGNESDRKMGIPGEDLKGVYSATEFVGWYNGHPDFTDRRFQLAESKRIAVVGNGNVAMDVARVLARDPDDLAVTDIADYALDALRGSTVEDILLFGRRGPAQAAFSPSEIKELGGLESADIVISKETMQLGEVTERWLENQADRDAKKNVDILNDFAASGPGDAAMKVHCHFQVSPVEFLGENGRLTAVKLEKNELYASDDGTPRPRGTGETWEEPVDMIFKAIGYRGIPIPGVPFHERWGVTPNEAGRVVEMDTNEPVPGLYVVGWAKRGPTGLIGTNRPDSVATVESMLADVANTTAPAEEKKTSQAIDALLEAKGIDTVSYADWKLLDAEEIARGEANGKIRDKYTSVDAMMAALQDLRTRVE